MKWRKRKMTRLRLPFPAGMSELIYLTSIVTQRISRVNFQARVQDT